MVASRSDKPVELKPVNPTDFTDIELDSLIELFYDDPGDLGTFEKIDRADVPEPSNALLAHDYHMTVTVERHHGCPVDVVVHQTRRDENHYARKIVLTRQTDQQVVMFGLVRLDLSVLNAAVRAEIESQEIPLGRILIKHNVLRKVRLLSLFRIRPGKELAGFLQLKPGQTCYGRTALIYCDEKPAIELLEIVDA